MQDKIPRRSINVMTKSYRGVRQLRTFKERFEYLSLRGSVGESTFGFDRYVNQRFYRSREWRDLRSHIIVRDDGCDLGVPGYEITGRMLIHHINPITMDHIKHSSELLLDPDNLITVTHDTHNAIHYGDESLLEKPLVERRPGDTKLW